MAILFGRAEMVRMVDSALTDIAADKLGQLEFLHVETETQEIKTQSSYLVILRYRNEWIKIPILFDATTVLAIPSLLLYDEKLYEEIPAGQYNSGHAGYYEVIKRVKKKILDIFGDEINRVLTQPAK